VRSPWLAILLAAACSHGAGQPVDPQPPPPPPPVDAAPPPPPPPVVLSVIGTNDLHGQIHALPWLAGYLDNLRKARSTDGGVVLVDAGDMFQGTLESNLDEGSTVISAYRLLGYDAAAIGNHEFDFGPEGPAVMARSPGDDPRGALEARGRQAGFPLLMANVVDAATGAMPQWPGFAPSVIKEVAGIKVGIIGVTTMSTPTTTMPANFVGLAMTPITDTITREAAALRKHGAAVVVVAAHAGGMCMQFSDPDDLDSCEDDSEVFEVARGLPAGTVDVIIAGHTHAGIAHNVAGVAVVEAFTGGRSFDRVDLTIDPSSGAVTARHIFPPQRICSAPPPEPCAPGSYEGAPVVASPAVTAAIEPAFVRAREKRDEQLGVRLDGDIRRANKEESALGNLFSDLMRQARPADVAITNGGGLRASLPAGALTYGELYEAAPFDNRFAMVDLTGADLRHLIATNLGTGTGLVSLSGVRAVARCVKGALVVDVIRSNGKPVKDRDRLKLVTSDFLAQGGDGLFTGLNLPPTAFHFEDGDPIRDVMAAELRKRGGVIAPRTLFDPAHPRLAFPGRKPVSCE